MSVTPEVRELAAKTAAEIRRRGWGQGDMAIFTDAPRSMPALDQREAWYAERAKDCKVCLVGGVAAAADGDPRVGQRYADRISPASGAVVGLLAEINDRIDPGFQPDFQYDIGRVIDWNDQYGRTAGEVLALLDSIAAPQAMSA